MPEAPTVANAPAEIAVGPEQVEPGGLEGLWPSPKLLDLMLRRWAEEACEEYDLDPEQRVQVREEVTARFGRFLNENRSAIQPLANEFIEMRMELQPPAAQRVQAWADRALPVFEKGREQVRQSHEDFRKVLQPTQRAKFEVDALKLGVGMSVAEAKLTQWKQGQVDNDVFWERLPAERRARRDERRRRRTETEEPQVAAQAASVGPVDQVALEMGRWEECVANFIRTYQLDDGQRTTALSCLSELRERALSHRDRRREEIAQLEKRIEQFSGSPEALADLKKQLTELYGPIDEMFKELQSRLEPIPTSGQRAQAVESARQEQPSPEAASAEKPPTEP